MTDKLLPRRYLIDQQTPTERAIRHAIDMVESLGPSSHLAAARLALENAFQYVADWTDAQAPVVATMAAPDAEQGGQIKAIHVTVGPDGKTEDISVDTHDSTPRVIPLNRPQTDGVIKTLENYLRIAKERGLSGVAVAAIDMEGCTSSAYEQGHNIAALIGANARLQLRLLNHVSE